MKRISASGRFMGLILLAIPIHAWPQTSAIPWSSFSGGFGVSSSANTTVYSSAGEIVGTAEGGNTSVRSGFLVIRLQPGATTAIDMSEGLPTTYALHPAYPNPFNPVTTLRYDLPERAELALTIYDLLGREVRRWQVPHQAAGYHTLRWDGADSKGNPVASGVYLYRLEAGGFTQARKMVLLR